MEINARGIWLRYNMLVLFAPSLVPVLWAECDRIVRALARWAGEKSRVAAFVVRVNIGPRAGVLCGFVRIYSCWTTSNTY